jgi:hypothetical protein
MEQYGSAAEKIGGRLHGSEQDEAHVSDPTSLLESPEPLLRVLRVGGLGAPRR